MVVIMIIIINITFKDYHHINPIITIILCYHIFLSVKLKLFLYLFYHFSYDYIIIAEDCRNEYQDSDEL